MVSRHSAARLCPPSRLGGGGFEGQEGDPQEGGRHTFQRASWTKHLLAPYPLDVEVQAKCLGATSKHDLEDKFSAIPEQWLLRGQRQILELCCELQGLPSLPRHGLPLNGRVCLGSVAKQVSEKNLCSSFSQMTLDPNGDTPWEAL